MKEQRREREIKRTKRVHRFVSGNQPVTAVVLWPLAKADVVTDEAVDSAGSNKVT